jgi:hypothetical protein
VWAADGAALVLWPASVLDPPSIGSGGT